MALSSSRVQDVAGSSPESGSLQDEFEDIQRRLARRTRIRRITRGVIGGLVVLAIWQVLSMLYHLTLILPTPLMVVEKLGSMLTLQEKPWPYHGSLYWNAGASLLRCMIGFALGAIVAIPIGLAVGKSTRIRELFGPVFGALYPIPGSAWIPLAFLWFGLSNTSVVFVVFISAFFPLYFNVESGVRAIPPLLVDAGHCFGARRFGLMRRVIFPGTMPFMVTGLRIAVGSSWRVIVVAEMLVGQSGVGYMLTQAQFFFRAADLLSVMVVVGVVGYVTEKVVVGTIERRTIQRWG